MDDGAPEARNVLARRMVATSSSNMTSNLDEQTRRRNRDMKARFNASHATLIAFLLLFAVLHIIGIYLFTNGFLLTRLVLDNISECAVPPIPLHDGFTPGTSTAGCWHPKSFDKAVIIIVDALRYDFTIPFSPSSSSTTPHHYHDGMKVLHELATQRPSNAFLRPFIADPPTTTLTRLKGLTTGNMPAFFEAGSNFAGTAIDEDNIVAQLHSAGKRVVHLGDDTWHSLFPGLFEPNLTRAYDSFNVWDLHTVDEGVNEHLMPLLQPGNASEWDVIIGHYLGVDHAGHRYGPDHPAMAAKLKQMDEVIRQIVRLIDDDTLLVIMGDHGMDSKGDHGGESEDEVEAALWMYSKRPAFGRLSEASRLPPATAKERPVNQIDLVPTFSLLLGIPIPFSNLGAPIEEAFIGASGEKIDNLAAVSRLTAAQIHRYQKEYALISSPDAASTARLEELWDVAMLAHSQTPVDWEGLASQFSAYQEASLAMCKALWARFDPISMGSGVLVLLSSLILLAVFASGLKGDTTSLVRKLVTVGSASLMLGAVIGLIMSLAIPAAGALQASCLLAAMCCCGSWAYLALSSKQVSLSMPESIWSWFLLLCVVLQSIGFGSNSFTIWEDELLLFFLISAGILLLAQSVRLPTTQDRRRGILHSLIFLIAIRVAAMSRLCREEQMPWGMSTYYASATSSTSAPWQLSISWVVALVLPFVLKSYYRLTNSYHGSVPLWIGVAFRLSLLLIAIFWTLDAADDGDWLVGVEKETLKTIRMYIAQFVLCIAAGAGTATFGYMSPCIAVTTMTPTVSRTTEKSKKKGAPITTTERPRIVVQGMHNIYGSHFAILPLTVLLIPLLLVQKPMGQGALSLIVIAILSMLEVLHLLRQTQHPPTSTTKSTGPTTAPTSTSTPTTPSPASIGPVLLALLAHFTYFKTGHQATLASIQWDSAFIPLRTIRYPWSPLMVLLNTFAGPILCAAAVPACVLWRRELDGAGRRNGGGSADTAGADSDAKPTDVDASSSHPQGTSGTTTTTPTNPHTTLLTSLARAQLTHILVYATYNLATTVLAGHLRRHLMLYRVFCPRWMLGGALLVVAEVVGALVGVGSVRWVVGGVAGVFA